MKMLVPSMIHLEENHSILKVKGMAFSLFLEIHGFIFGIFAMRWKKDHLLLLLSFGSYCFCTYFLLPMMIIKPYSAYFRLHPLGFVQVTLVPQKKYQKSNFSKPLESFKILYHDFQHFQLS